MSAPEQDRSLQKDDVEIAMTTDGMAHAFRWADDGLIERPVCGAEVERLPDSSCGDDDDVCDECYEAAVERAASVQWRAKS